MSIHQTKHRIAIPDSLVRQLRDYRKRVWTIKIAESIGIAFVSVLFGFLAVFGLDRLFDSPAWLRAIVLLGTTCGVATIPLWIQRWIVRVRSAESVAMLLGKRMPTVGDALLGAIELSHSDSEQSRSPALCKAALEQVAKDSAKKDFLAATPNSQHRTWGTVAAVGLATMCGLWILFPAAVSNAWARFAAPLANIQRYTFAAIEPLPDRVVVPHGEAFPISVKLSEKTEWSPQVARASIGNQSELESPLQKNGYQFEMPPQIENSTLRLAIGDATPNIKIEPKLRPELESIEARIQLPKYLGRDELLTKDVRGGGLAVVMGANVSFQANATRELTSATANQAAVEINKASFTSSAGEIKESRKVDFEWTDEFGLTAKSPFSLNITARPDEAPSVFGDGLPHSKVLLDSELVQFHVRAIDDFGVKNVGMEWKTAPNFKTSKPVQGEQMLLSGTPIAETLDGIAVFQATALKIEPQPLEVRLFVEDYLPERGRVYSSPHTLYVLDPNEHAIWMLEQLSKWQRESLEVRDRELQLLDTNKKIRDLSEDELNKEETRRKIEQQSAAEQANGRRLSNLTNRGEELLRQAARNPEIGVGHLEKWAEMHQILKDIASNRMPSVADLLKQAKDEKKLSKAGASPSDANSAPKVGMNRDSSNNPSTAQTEPSPQPNKTPSISDQESSQQPPIEVAGEEQSKKKGSAPSLRLPSTTVAGKPNPSKKGNEEENEAEEPQDENKVAEAVRKQEELLAEFQKVADELNQLMANLEGSTLVKRLKAASREQMLIADATSDELSQAFGSTLSRLKSEQQTRIKDLKAREEGAVNTVGLIIDDLEAFHQRRPMVKFQSVLDDMKSENVIIGIRSLSDRVLESQGLAIAEAEYWSDTLDRWAEDLVDPACKGECKGCKSKGSLPPSLILEVMKILEAEINLRDRTRVAEQSKPANEEAKYLEMADELAIAQMDLQDRIVVVRQKIEELPDAEADFGKEIQLMQEVDRAMVDAAEILDRPNTGREAIAAETEVIELLLKSKRINPKGGGGGGANPGGGGGGDTQDAAIALLGPGINEKEVREDHGIQQATGTAGTSFPEEYRYGLDKYFEHIERSPQP